MKRGANALDFRGLVEHRHEADLVVSQPGQAVVVRRGLDRSLTMVCPDGCGETLTINLDHRAGPAWRLYIEDGKVSLYPSVWRHTGCKSHFIVWRSRIYWCDWNEEFLPTSADFEERVLAALDDRLRPYATVADQLAAVPWAVLSACHHMQARGLVQSGSGDQRGWFRSLTRRKPTS